MTKLIVTMGKPASGKSTWATEQVSKEGLILRVNKDNIRNMLYSNGYTTAKELVVDAMERAGIEHGLKAGYDVIVDATNFNIGRLNDFILIAEDLKADLVIHRFMADVETCLHRNRKRSPEQQVPDEVILSMADKETELDLHFDFSAVHVILHA